MNNIDYCSGRISAFKELVSLMKLISPKDTVTKVQVKLLIEHAETRIKLDETIIDKCLEKMEELF